MANFLKLNKSYLGPEVLSNGSFNGYGPEKVTNGDFATDIEGWKAKDSSIAYDNGKLKVTLSTNNAGGAYQNIGLVAGKQYEMTITMQILSGSNGSLGLMTSTTGGSTQSVVYQGGTLVSGGQAVTETFTFTPSSTGVSIQPYIDATNTVFTIDNVSVKETGIQELVTNGYFTNVSAGTVVTTLSQWTAGNPNLSTATVTDNVLTCTSTANNQYVTLNVPTVVGTEYKFNIAKITGDLAVNTLAATFKSSGEIDVDVTSGSASFTFVAEITSLILTFYAGDHSSGKTTTFSNISMQPTNQFAYGYERYNLVGNAGGVNSVFNFSDKTLKFTAQSANNTVIKVSGDATSANEEYLVKIDVKSISGDCDFIWFVNNAYDSIPITVGENEYRYKKTGTNQSIYFGIKGEIGSSFTLNSVSLQEIVNQPKLIGVDNVSMVSAPTVNTVKINNGLTDGADTLTITYVGASASSKVQMRNFFQDSIISLANGNNTDEVLEITPPVLITDIVAS